MFSIELPGRGLHSPRPVARWNWGSRLGSCSAARFVQDIYGSQHGIAPERLDLGDAFAVGEGSEMRQKGICRIRR
jgi:hypothetical protein